MPYKDPEDKQAWDKSSYLANKERKQAQMRAYYQSNKKTWRARNVVYQAKLTTLYRDLKNKPCADCGVEYPYYVMQYDHRGDKIDDVSRFLRQHKRAAMLAEIAKCDVVCANCHATRTWKRQYEV